MGRILLVITRHQVDLCDRTPSLPCQIFPPSIIEAAKRYRFDEELRNDPVEYQRIYEELKVEVALLVIVRIDIPLVRFRTSL